MVQRCPHILVDAHGLVGAPKEAASEEGRKEENTVVPLRAGAGHT